MRLLMLASLLPAVAHAAYDQCDRPVAQWAGVNQVRRPYERHISRALSPACRRMVRRPQATAATTVPSTTRAASSPRATSAQITDSNTEPFNPRLRSQPRRFCPDHSVPT